MNLDEIKALIAVMDDAALSEIEVEDSGRRVRLRREITLPAGSAPVARVLPKGATDVSEAAPLEKEEVLNQHHVTSPIVGTFYTSSSPSMGPYVAVGDLVKKGQILCIVEAMKLMNEIECDVEGRIVKICVEDGAAVEYGESLFLVELA